MDLASVTLQDLVDAIADAVVAKMGGASAAPAVGTEPELLAPPVDPPATTKKSRKSAGAPPPETQPTAVVDTDAQAATESEPTTDLPTPEQLAFSKEVADGHPIAEIGNELLEYYVSCGHSKEDISAALAEMKEPAKRAAYHDYIARLVTKVDNDAKANGKFLPVLDTAELNFIAEPLPYVAERIYDGVVTKVWVNWAVTMEAEAIQAAGLPDPATVGVPAAAATSAAPPRRTLPVGKKK